MRASGWLFTVLALAMGQAAYADSWPFTPDADHFSPEAMVDLRSLNEKVAGEKGFVGKSKDGNDFVLGDGTPARFWSVNDHNGDLLMVELEHHARWLAKRGVNMVRLHMQLSPEKGRPFLEANDKEIERIFKTVAAMKKEGIYTTISPYWASIRVPKEWGVAGEADQNDQPAWGLLFFDAKMQEGYKAWAKKLLTTVNPHTGITLAKDPAVAILQIQNEDSLLFWTEQGIKGPQLDGLRKLFGVFLARKYGSLDKAKAAWRGATIKEDDFATGMPGMYILWDLTQPQTGDKAKRAADQAEFLTQTMRDFNTQIADYFHKDLGCKQLVNAGNWMTADPVKLYDLERYAYTACDVVAVNRYFTGIHQGPKSGWAEENGDRFTNASALKDPRALPLNVRQVAGFPTIITESGWVNPDLYQSEGPFLTAVYSSLTGIDSLFWFSMGDVAEWQQAFNKSVNGWHPPMSKWNIGTPMQLGQFPAAAFLFRNGYVKKASPVVKESRSLDELWRRELPVIAEDQSYDPNRNAGDAGRKSASLSADPLAFLVGPVTVSYGKAAPPFVLDMNSLIRRKDSVVDSATKEISLNWAVGYCTLNAPAAQGATGFLKAAGPLKLTDITLTVENDYASVLAVSLDKAPLKSSRKILVQIGTTERPTNWRERPQKFLSTDKKKEYDGFVIDSTGENPWRIEEAKGTLTIANPKLVQGFVLDANLMVSGKVSGVRKGDVVTFPLPAKALYFVLSE